MKKTSNLLDLPPFLGIKEMMQALRLCERTVLDLCRSGQLPARKIGKAWRLYAGDLIDYVRGKKA